MDIQFFFIITTVICVGYYTLYKLLKKHLADINQDNRKLFETERIRLNEATDTRVKIIEEHKNQILNAVIDTRKEINETKITSEKLKTTIENHNSITQTLQKTTNKLKDVLSNNQARGMFGQEIAEDLLKMAGFVEGHNYKLQEKQENNNKPDITLLLPDQIKLNIDVKFPFKALEKLNETEDEEQQKKYEADFKNDIKKQLNEVKNYINPQENTLDFVIFFIPNEMIFSYIYDKHPDLWKGAIEKKIILCGPLSFIAILRMVQQGYDNFRYQKNLHSIIIQIRSFENEFNKFNEHLDLLGKKISQVSSTFEEVSGVRNRQLTKILDKIKAAEQESINE